MESFSRISHKTLLEFSGLSDPIALPIVVKIVKIIGTLHKD